MPHIPVYPTYIQNHFKAFSLAQGDTNVTEMSLTPKWLKAA